MQEIFSLIYMKTSNMKKSVISILLLAGAFASPSSNAEEVMASRCKEFNWKPGDVMLVEAQRWKQTHITLPEEALDVVWGNKVLWDNDFMKNHIFVASNTDQPEGAETTISAIGSSGAAYEFKIRRVNQMTTHCVNIKSVSKFVNRSNWENKDSAAQMQVEVLQKQLAHASVERAQVVNESQRQTQMAIKSYRSALFSNYSWNEGSGWFASSGVESVQDDGRFTFIRLKSDSKGIMSVLAEIDGTPEVIEKTYDASKREYRIAGVYPKFKMRAGDSEITITRRGN